MTTELRGEGRRPPSRHRWVVTSAAVVLVAGVAVAVGMAVTPARAPVVVVGSAVDPSASADAAPMVEASRGSAPSNVPPASGSSVQQARASLDALARSAGGAALAYDRDRFGQRWADVDRNGCDTRNDILGRDLLDPVFKDGTRDCKVLSGTLIDPYDGAAVSFVSGVQTSAMVQIDHIVALGWAWQHGADAWTADHRTAFANDPRNLIAASAAMNQEKSDSGPSEWLPPVPELRCTYVENWVAVLADYSLSVDDADRAAARSVLEVC